MTHEKIATFYVAMVWNGIKAAWRSRHNHRPRHTMAYIGTKEGKWAVDLVWDLRLERAGMVT